MAEWFAKILEFLKLPLKYIWVALIVSSMLLFLPDKTLALIHADNLKQTYGTILGVVLLVSLILVLLDIVGWSWQKYKIYHQYRRHKNSVYGAICNLDSEEIAVLREFFLQDQNTIQLPITDSVVEGLLGKQILAIVGQYEEKSIAGILSSVAISAIAKPYITPELLGFPVDQTEENMFPIYKSRPSYIGEIKVHNETMHSSWRGRARQ